MSWIFGIVKDNVNKPIMHEYIGAHDDHLYKFSSFHLYLALGGISETCFYEFDEKSERGWAVVGKGIRLSVSGARFLSKEDWRNILSLDSLPVKELDGHFITLRWKENKIEIFSDQLELRTAYYSKSDIGICFSTRLDWVAKATGNTEINKKALGGRWLLFNQLGYESCISNIERLGPAAHIIIKDCNVIKKECNPWFPVLGNEKDDTIAKKTLEYFVNIPEKDYRSISLGLSGGLDSRTLLSILLAQIDRNFFVHTFGEPDDPDVFISERIAHYLKLNRQYFNDTLPNPETLFNLAKSFAAQNLLVEPCSSVLRLRYYNIQYDRNQILIDGGNGEIARRQFLNRVVKFGSRFIEGKNIPKLFSLMRVQRAEIFDAEYVRNLEQSAQNSLEETLDNMPSIDEVGIENFADLLSVRTRVPNFGGPEQARSDAYVINYMPMVQPSFLKAIFKLDIKMRKDGRLYRDIIKMNKPQLEQFQLVKSGATYPYFLESYTAWLYIKIKNKFKSPYLDTTPTQFLLALKEKILDLVYSSEIKSIDFYDYNKIRTNVEKFYKGEHRLTNFVNWWFTFELWRETFYK